MPRWMRVTGITILVVVLIVLVVVIVQFIGGGHTSPIQHGLP